MNGKRNLFTKIIFTIFLTIFLFTCANAQETISLVAEPYNVNKAKSIKTWDKAELDKYNDFQSDPSVTTTASNKALNEKEPQTVKDFYYLLPEKYFPQPDFDDGPKLSQRAFRKSIIETEDIKNGYLSIMGGFKEGWVEVAIFKKTNGKYIVGISSIGCGPVCSNEDMDFLSYENGKWRNVTNEVLQKISEAQVKAAYKRKQIEDEYGLVYELPRVGTTIKVKSGGDYGDTDFNPVNLFELNWNGISFVLKTK